MATETPEATTERERLLLFARTERLLPKYGDLAALALNQAALLLDVRFDSAEHYEAAVAEFDAWHETRELFEEFTDEVLAPTRTLRMGLHPLRDRLEVVPGDELLVDVNAYTGARVPLWCSVTALSPGSASTFPYKVQVPQHGVGQFKAGEVLGWRRPLEFHRMLMVSLHETPYRDDDPLFRFE